MISVWVTYFIWNFNMRRLLIFLNKNLISKISLKWKVQNSGRYLAICCCHQLFINSQPGQYLVFFYCMYKPCNNLKLNVIIKLGFKKLKQVVSYLCLTFSLVRISNLLFLLNFNLSANHSSLLYKTIFILCSLWLNKFTEINLERADEEIAMRSLQNLICVNRTSSQLE